MSRVTITADHAELIARKLGEVASARVRRRAVNEAGKSARKELPELIASTYHTSKAGVGARGKAAAPGAEDPIYRLLLNRSIRIARLKASARQFKAPRGRRTGLLKLKQGAKTSRFRVEKGAGPWRIPPSRKPLPRTQGAALGRRADIAAKRPHHQAAPRADRRRPGRRARLGNGGRAKALGTMSGHPVLDDPDLSAPLDLIRFDGSALATRGVMSRLPESAADVQAGYSQRGRQAWVSLESPLLDHEVEFLQDAAGARFPRAHHHELERPAPLGTVATPRRGDPVDRRWPGAGERDWQP